MSREVMEQTSEFHAAIEPPRARGRSSFLVVRGGGTPQSIPPTVVGARGMPPLQVTADQARMIAPFEALLPES